MNNKGFAITTVLYGTFILFLLLIVTMLSIVANYKDKMERLIDNTNGARDIVDIYKKDALFMTIDGVKFYKQNAGIAIIAYGYNGRYTSPLLVSTTENSVVYKSSSGKQYFADGSIEYKNTKYYYSALSNEVSGIYEINNYPLIEGYTDAESAAMELLKNKVKYFE